MEPHFTRAQALRTPSFWLLCLFALVAYPVQAGVSLHQAPYLIERGVSPAVAAAVVSTFSFMSGVASLGFGFFPRSQPIRYAMALSGAALSAGTFAMLGIRTPIHAYAAAGLFGIGVGGLLTLLPIAWADYFRPRQFRRDPRHRALGPGAGPSDRSPAFRCVARLVRQLSPVARMFRRPVLSERAYGHPRAPAKPRRPPKLVDLGQDKAGRY